MELWDEIAAEREISKVLHRYARSADRHDWEGVRSCFHPEATDDHLDYKGGIDGLVTWLAERHEALESSVHQLGNMTIEVRDDRSAVSETYCITAQRSRPDASPDGVAQDLVVFSRYVDRHERHGGGPWLIAERAVVMSFSRLVPATGGFSDPDARPSAWQVGMFGADDPAYAALGLTWHS